MANVFNVNCMMCGRASGHVREGRFHRLPTAPPLLNQDGRSRCGFCSGNVYLEAEDSPFAPRIVAQNARQQARRAS